MSGLAADGRCTFCGAQILGVHLDTLGKGTCHCGAEGRCMREPTALDAHDAHRAYAREHPSHFGSPDPDDRLIP